MGLTVFRCLILGSICFVNWLILAVFLSAFGLGDFQAGMGAALVCAALVYLAFTPLGEAYFRFANRLRRPFPEEERSLRQLFERVCASCGAVSAPELFISPEPDPNACAVGKNTVAVTLGLLQTASEEEIAGVLAHELGHLEHGDTKILLVAYVMNMVGSVATWIATAMMAAVSVFGFAVGGMSGDEDLLRLGWIALLLMWTLRGIAWLLNWALRLSFLAVGRAEEYRADEYAAKRGFRDGLAAFLNRVWSASGRRRTGFAAALLASHPAPEKRIERLMGGSVGAF